MNQEWNFNVEAMMRYPSSTNRPATRSFRNAPVTVTLTGLLLLSLTVLMAPLASAAVIERFQSDPLTGSGRNPFFIEGDAAARFTYLAHEPRHFPGDRKGTLRVLYDTTLPAGRIATPLGEVLSFDDDISFGAILTIRSQGLVAAPDGFSQIAFGLWNSATTGLGRTLFPADSFDLLEFDYFLNVTPFGGPFLTPTAFGGNVGDNAFFNFAFQSSEVTLPLDVPLLCRFQYDGSERRLELTVSRHRTGMAFEPIPGATVAVDLSALSPTFLVDVIGIAAYHEGIPSLHVEVDYDLLFVGELPVPFGRARKGRLNEPVPSEPLP